MTDGRTVRPRSELAAVVHQEAARAAELVLLHRHDRDSQFFAGQVRTGQLEGFSHLGLVEIASA